MPRNPRNTDPSVYRHIVVRTRDRRFLMLPKEVVVMIIGGIIARYQEMYRIEIYGLVALSNHVHILIKAPDRNTSSFMKMIDREISRRLKYLWGYDGDFWGSQRYSDEICPESKDALEALLYIITNPVKHELVSHPSKWPGLSSYQIMKSGGSMEFDFIHYGEKVKEEVLAKREGRKANPEVYTTRHTLKISNLPDIELLSPEETLEELVEKRTKALNSQMGKKKYLGARKISLQSYLDRPKTTPTRKPQPVCYSKCPQTIKIFMEEHRAWIAEYREASKRYQSGEFEVKFPPNCIKPIALSPP